MSNVKAILVRQLPNFNLLIFITVATIGAFSGGIWAGIGIGFSVIMFIFVWLDEHRVPRPEARLLHLVLLTMGMCALLNLRSTQPHLSWLMWERLVTIFLPLSLLTAATIQKHAASPKFFAILTAAVLTGAVALSLELVLQGPLLKWWRGPAAELYQYNRGLSHLILLAFPAMAGLALTKRRWLVIPFALVLFIPASLTESRAAKLALVLALLTVLAMYIAPAVTRRMLALVPILAIGWPFVTPWIFIHHHDWLDRLPRSWQDRVEIWDYMSYRILDRPLLGWGLGSSSKLPFKEPHGALYTHELGGAAHPHNAIIQLWVELGLPGLVLGIGFALLVFGATGRLRREIAPYAAGAWMAAFCLSMIAYNFWTDSLWAAFALTGFAFSLLQRAAGKLHP